MRRIQCNAKQFNPGIGPALKYDRPALKYDRLTLKEGEGGEGGKGGRGGGRLYIITITSSSILFAEARGGQEFGSNRYTL